MPFTADDVRFMAQALRLAEQGLYTTMPNPRVGCVLVREDVVGEYSVVGEGFHARAGEPHAEVHALRMAGEHAQGATAYVTLEPCAHQGRTGPCADALIQAGVVRVVAAMQDPNPQVSGQGFERLRAAGIVVQSGLMESAAQALNAGFVRRMQGGLPWVRLKMAASLDGRTAMASGESQWITDPQARADVQRLRARSCAIVTGIGTVLADDPSLTVREIATGRQPRRVIVDSHLRTPLSAKVLQAEGALLAGCCADDGRQQALRQAGADIVLLPAAGADPGAQDVDTKGVDLPALLRLLAQQGCNEVLVEAGATLAGAFIRAGLVDELVLYLAPMLLGESARAMAQLGIATLAESVRWQTQDVRMVGNDLRWILKS